MSRDVSNQIMVLVHIRANFIATSYLQFTIHEYFWLGSLFKGSKDFAVKAIHFDWNWYECGKYTYSGRRTYVHDSNSFTFTLNDEIR